MGVKRFDFGAGSVLRQVNRALAVLLTACAMTGSATPAIAQEEPGPPKLLVVISVDQLSSDLFNQYRRHFTGGFARLASGAVFSSGYQSHAATETCPGHSTITTGARPARTGIIANEWTDLNTGRSDKTIYCVEDETVPGSTSTRFTVSEAHLLVPTLGERMKAANPASRVVAIGGKDRSTVLMGGRGTDESWWWDGTNFRSHAGRPVPRAVSAANAEIAARIARAQPDLSVPEICRPRVGAIAIGDGRNVGTAAFGRAAGDYRAFRASPEFDSATLKLAAAMVTDLKLGKGSAPDILTIGAAATDYVGHTYGPAGVETCIQLWTLDRDLKAFFATMDAAGIDYAVALTADHGGIDLPERTDMNAGPAERVDPALKADVIGTAIARRLGLKGQLLWGGHFGDMWIDPAVTGEARAKVLAEAVATFRAHRQVHEVLTAAEILATPISSVPPDSWTLLERARASFNTARSGDFIVVLKPRVTPIAKAGHPYVATHGSPWDYDRRVPIIFWRQGMPGFEQPLSIETVDIAPTLAALINLPIAPGDMDGRCLDLQPGEGNTCTPPPTRIQTR